MSRQSPPDRAHHRHGQLHLQGAGGRRPQGGDIPEYGALRQGDSEQPSCGLPTKQERLLEKSAAYFSPELAKDGVRNCNCKVVYVV